jgi:hypothetical protein
LFEKIANSAVEGSDLIQKALNLPQKQYPLTGLVKLEWIGRLIKGNLNSKYTTPLLVV